MTAGNDNGQAGLPPIGSLSDTRLVAAAIEVLGPLCGGSRLLGQVIAKPDDAVSGAAAGTGGFPRAFARPFARPEAVDGPRLRLTLTGIAVALTAGAESVSAGGDESSDLTVPGLILGELLARSLVDLAGAGVPAGPSYLHVTPASSGGTPALLLTSYFSTGPVG